MAEPILYSFVDNSNVLIEAQRFWEMKRKGRSKLSPYTDDSYQIDWGKFLYVLKEKDTRGMAEVPVLYGSRPPANDSVWQRIRDGGFDVKVFDRNIRNKEKGVDMEMGMDIAELLHTVKPPNRNRRRGRGFHSCRPTREEQGMDGRSLVLEQRRRRP